ncbi:hypothetical protein STAFG_8706 [Streptomyces afghaniensis 772]|uniref:Uncharacterized protein n=1 Tax=Streptomyces afghaniensis 772 TaxID=1283301 RepID=S4MD01_9ACTN|nr:hypothetical protein STAFG_8706 [Streptomyces afghaniensis 772]
MRCGVCARPSEPPWSHGRRSWSCQSWRTPVRQPKD